MRSVGAGRYFFAAAMIGLAVLAFRYDDFALVWQKVPAWVIGRGVLAYACAVVMLLGGAGLLVARTAPAAARMLLVYLLLWFVLLRLPEILLAPAQVISWSGCGETAVMLSGAWMLYALSSAPAATGVLAFAGGARGVRGARALLGIALIPCGLAHFAYAQETAALVPAWLPAHSAWAYATGAGFIAAGAAILTGVWARLAAVSVTFMMAAFTLFVWLPGVIGAPGKRLQWTAFFISLAITAGAWVVADAYERVRSEARTRVAGELTA